MGKPEQHFLLMYKYVHPVQLLLQDRFYLFILTAIFCSDVFFCSLATINNFLLLLLQILQYAQLYCVIVRFIITIKVNLSKVVSPTGH
jgi:hypothetical protein